MFLLKLVSLLSKSVFVTQLAYFNLAVKFSAINLLNSGVVIYLSWSGNLFSDSPIFVLRTVVATKLLVFGILFLNSLILCSK